MNYERRTYELATGQISAVHFGRTSNPLKLVFLHANGFNALTYRTILEKLGVHALALDLRGHGMTTLPTDLKNLRNWHIFANDVADFLSAHVKGKIVLGGHSLGATISVLTAEKIPSHVSGLCAFDPVTIPALIRVLPYLPGGRTLMKTRFPLAVKAGKRRAYFDSAEAAFVRYKGRGTFKNINETVLKDYLEGGVIPDGGGVKLACDPLWEQAIYASHGHNIYRAAQTLPPARHLIYFGINGASTAKSRAKISPIVGAQNIEFHKDFSHFHPLEHPDFAVEKLGRVLKMAALGR